MSDVIVIGGGAIGSAVAYGLARRGQSVVMLDEGDQAFRAARGNAGLIWYQLKGLGLQAYSELCLQATELWAEFAEELQCNTNIDLHYTRNGGVEFCKSDEEYRSLSERLAAFRAQSPKGVYDSDMIDRQELQALMPKLKLGQHVVGGSYSPHDGQVYTPALLQALHRRFQELGGVYLPGRKVTEIRTTSEGFEVQANGEHYSAGKIVLAAGLGLQDLGKMLDVDVPVSPQRGQLIVTEKMPQMLSHPAGGIRQTPAGNFLLGASKEWAGLDETVTPSVLKTIATNWIEIIPQLRDVAMIRSWAALRPMTPDGAPIYQTLADHPGAYVMTSHSGISLASINAGPVAEWIADDTGGKPFSAFGLDRFENRQEDLTCSAG